MNKSISYPLAKLLKEKGFDEPCPNLYYQPERCKKPTIADVCMWLYEKHDIWIVVFPTEENWTFDIFNKIECVKSESFINSPTESYEAAIEFCLTKLI